MSEHALAVEPDVGALADRFAALTVDAELGAAASAAASTLRADPPDPARRRRLAAAHGLSPFEQDVVALAGLPEEHEAFSRVAAALHPRGEPWLTPGVIAAALDLDGMGRGHLRGALDAGPLRRHRIVHVQSGPPWPEAPLRLATGLWSVLRGHDCWPEELERLPLAVGDGVAGAALRLGDAVGRAGDGAMVVVLTGPDARPVDELAAVASEVLARCGRDVVALTGEGLDAERGQLASAHALARGVVPVVVGAPPGPPLLGHPGPVVVCVPTSAALAFDHRPHVTVDLGERTLAERTTMWEQLLPELDGDARALAGLLRVDPVRARVAVHDARLAADIDGGAIDAGAVVAHARRRTDRALPGSVRLVAPEAGWADLVTTASNAALLRSVVDRVRGQVQVLHDWGFGRTGSGRGARVLLAGPPGTGKSLSAHIVASALGLDLLVVDLSALVSKWLGETEKNIAEVFGAAERSQAVLFFDEADAIFGRRTDAGDAQARWANLETAYLLSRIDTFDGLVLLATNLRANIDDAFVRRLDVVVEFDEPSADERLRLWDLHLPPSAPLAADVDAAQLAELYPMTGGLIANASLDAAFAAAAASEAITQSRLLDAVEREYQKAGRTFPGRPRRPVALVAGGH
jgi:hypothetical protein